MLDANATLSIPEIEIVTEEELYRRFKELHNDSFFFSTQCFEGNFSGEIAFFINEKSAKNLTLHLELSDDETDDAVMELTNILTSTLVSRLAQEMQSEVSFSAPNIKLMPLHDIAKSAPFKKYKQIIIIQTKLMFEEQEISGNIFILTRDESITWLKTTIQNIFESLI
jgi:chemotaxis protein CheC